MIDKNIIRFILVQVGGIKYLYKDQIEYLVEVTKRKYKDKEEDVIREHINFALSLIK